MKTQNKRILIITLAALTTIIVAVVGIIAFSPKMPFRQDNSPNNGSPQLLRGVVTQAEQGKDGLQVEMLSEGLLYSVTIRSMQAEIDGSFDQIVVGAEIEVSGQRIAGMNPPLITADYVRVLGSPPPLAGTTWVLTAYNDQQPISDRQPTLQFEAGQVSGTTGCNHYGGSYQANDSSIAFEGIFSTEMACEEPEGIMEQESTYLEILAAAQSYQLAGGLLTIFAENDQTLTYQPLPDSQSGQGNPADNQATLSQTNPTSEPQPTQSSNTFEPPAGFKEYQDALTGISIFIPEAWYIQYQNIVEGDYAIFSSYPPDKYIGGEGREPGDTKCDLNLNPDVDSIGSLVQKWESSPMTTIVSEEEFVLDSGISGVKFVIDSMGRATMIITKINGSLVTFSCWGEFELFDEIATTVHATVESSP